MADQTPAPAAKKPYLSKTLWANALINVAALIPVVNGYVADHAAMVIGLIGALNVALRLLTKDKIGLDD